MENKKKVQIAGGNCDQCNNEEGNGQLCKKTEDGHLCEYGENIMAMVSV